MKSWLSALKICEEELNIERKSEEGVRKSNLCCRARSSGREKAAWLNGVKKRRLNSEGGVCASEKYVFSAEALYQAWKSGGST